MNENVEKVRKNDRKCWNCDNFCRSTWDYYGECILNGKKKRNDSSCTKFERRTIV